MERNRKNKENMDKNKNCGFKDYNHYLSMKLSEDGLKNLDEDIQNYNQNVKTVKFNLDKSN